MTTSRIDPQTEQIYQRPGFLLRRAHQLSVGLFERYCKQFDLTPPQYGVLSVLSYTEQLDQVSLSKALGHDKVTTLHIVRGMEAKGLVRKTETRSGRRRVFISISEEGRKLLQTAAPSAASAYAHLLSPLAEKEQVMLIDMLERICAELEETARAPMNKVLPAD